jgi:diguanylate cyclase (GGDEF)-like protein/PAS domain S-box-containing protein
MKWPVLGNLEGKLPENLEKGYREYYLKTDTRVAGVAMIFFAILLAAFAYSDYLLFGLAPLFFILLSFRIAFCMYFVALLLYLRKNTIPPKFDSNLFIWLLTGIVLVTFINSTRPPTYVGNIAIDVILILLVFMGMPMKMRFRVVGAAVFTVGEMVMLLFFRHGEGSAGLFANLVALVMANILGIFSSSLLFSFRRREYAERIEKEEIAREWQSTFNSITDMISIQDVNCRLVRVNKAYADAFQKTAEDLEGKPCFEVVHGTKEPIDNCPHIKTFKTSKTQIEEIFEPKLGKFLEITTSPIFDSSGKLIYTVHLTKDVSERKKMENNLTQMATHDGLTGLPNRTLLNDRFVVAMAKAEREKKQLALMIMDLDKFKTINDTYGHATGDRLLKAVASRLKDIMRKSDTVARIGGDEFVVLLPEINDSQNATRAAGKILRSFAGPFLLDDVSVTVTASIGIAIWPEHGRDMESLLHNADSAMYIAKESGRNAYRFYEATIPTN